MKKIATLTTLIALSLSQAYSNEKQTFEEKTSTPSCAITLPEDVCDLDSSFSYWTVGIGPLPIPAFNLGVGARAKKDRFGADVSLNLATVGIVNALRASANGLCYVHQTPSAHTYVGLGASVGGIWGFSSLFTGGFEGYFAPNFICGREFLNHEGKRRFFQVEALYPVKGFSSGGWVNFAFFTLKYGFAF
ncbi:MAG: hypothetical protein KR126chlam1_01327 [Chlamydiae bacterium]|nr:hypothetical protein [Chlamydiota bacterium]